MGVDPCGIIASASKFFPAGKHVPPLMSTPSPKSFRSSVGCAPEEGPAPLVVVAVVDAGSFQFCSTGPDGW